MDNVQKLVNYLSENQNLKEMSVNERSLEIFHDEKFLSSKEGKSLMKRHHITLFSLKAFNTPEPFIYYCNKGSSSRKALIIENKDTWYSMRKVLQEKGSVCGQDFKALIYGEGRKIQNSFLYIEEKDTENIKGVREFYYFGDIDSSGIDIFYKLKKEYRNHKILAFKEGYLYLVRNSFYGHFKETKGVNLSGNKLVGLFPFFDNKTLEQIVKICNANYLIPQEIMNYQVLCNWEKDNFDDGQGSITL